MCDWTSRRSCPGQKLGSQGIAVNDDSVEYQCCCEHGLWDKKNTSLRASFLQTPSKKKKDHQRPPPKNTTWDVGTMLDFRATAAKAASHFMSRLTRMVSSASTDT